MRNANVITNENEIEFSVNKLREALIKVAGKELLTNLSYQGGVYRNVIVYFSSKLNMWFFFRSLTGNKYIHAFGLGKPRSNVSAILEINFPAKGRSHRIAGIFVRDSHGITWVAHNGKIGGGRQGISLKTFWRYYRGDCIDLWESGVKHRFALIGYLGSDELPNKIKKFVLEVNAIKKIITSSSRHLSLFSKQENF